MRATKSVGGVQDVAIAAAASDIFAPESFAICADTPSNNKRASAARKSLTVGELARNYTGP